jgi:hypothetical protein
MLLTPKEAATQYQLNEKTLRRYADDGKVPYVKTGGGHRRYVVESLEKLFNAKTATNSEVEKLKKENRRLRDRIKRMEKTLKVRELNEILAEEAKEREASDVAAELESINQQFGEWRLSDPLIDEMADEEDGMDIYKVWGDELHDYTCEISDACLHESGEYFIKWRNEHLSDHARFISDELENQENNPHVKYQLKIFSAYHEKPAAVDSLIEYDEFPSTNLIQSLKVGVEELECEIKALIVKREDDKGFGATNAQRVKLQVRIDEKKVELSNKKNQLLDALSAHGSKLAELAINQLNESAEESIKTIARVRVWKRNQQEKQSRLASV